MCSNAPRDHITMHSLQSWRAEQCAESDAILGLVEAIAQEMQGEAEVLSKARCHYRNMILWSDLHTCFRCIRTSLVRT